jgi:hypothetical protein
MEDKTLIHWQAVLHRGHHVLQDLLVVGHQDDLN